MPVSVSSLKAVSYTHLDVYKRQCQNLPECDVPVVTLDAKDKREVKLHLPELSEGELSRHYTELAKKSHGVNDGFYPLGSCTMKYNPRVNEVAAGLEGFTDIHPLQPTETVQGLSLIHI